MIQNLAIVFSRYDMAVFTAIFIVVLLVIATVDTYRKSAVLGIVIAGFVWWIVLVMMYPPHGPNYNIYSYNAFQTLHGKNMYDQRSVRTTEARFTDPKYLDYTGAQHLLYVCMEFIRIGTIDRNLSAFGYRLWMLINISGILLLIPYLYASRGKTIEPNAARALLFISFCPVIPFYLLIAQWQDKFGFLLLPLLVYYLLQRKRFRTTSFLLGVIAALNGLTVFFIPAYVLYLFKVYNERRTKILIDLGSMAAGFVITMIPYFPESMAGWSHRFVRTNSDTPFWFSFYSFLPSGMYSHLVNDGLMLAGCSAVTVLYGLKKIYLTDALIASVSLVVLLSPYNVIARVVPLIIFIAVLTPEMKKYDWIVLSVIMYVFVLFDNGQTVPVIDSGNTLLFYIPVAYITAIYIYKRRLTLFRNYPKSINTL